MKLSIPKYWRRRFDYYSVIIAECLDCGKKTYPRKHICPYCKSRNVRAITSAGIGEVIAYTISYFRVEGSEEHIPKIVALIKLDDGPILIGELVDLDLSELREGLRVEAVLRKIRTDDPGGLIYYGVKFRPLMK
ncbi:MAG: Zn-ribbon domain-containing OB-fold protein [Sulfolobales archaeon]|nr:Zn-ribbon domain-containing OB-fold protein [Sulfolobales archaeon]MCX8186515.1 Zn-ribbon domain-containing OB-fold protein [Sulfolobales archaeon]MDW7969063.1 Zn-ribbon domain-containing OB-fold protein [Sulfolobales archaeon]